MKYSDANTPREYLEYVLNHWEAFCKVNGGLAKAIQDLLIVNEALTQTICDLIKREVTAQKDSD